MFSSRRLGKELAQSTFAPRGVHHSTRVPNVVRAQVHEGLPPGITLVSAPDYKEWMMDIQVLDANPIYASQTFRLRFRFNTNYPIEPPEATFLAVTTPPRRIPLHPHIYSNGIICLDLLGRQGWSPVQSVESVCMSIQSMLTGNSKAERPPGDDEFCRRTGMAGASARGLSFVYDDNTV